MHEPDSLDIGRDELNLAEMPIALISERVPKGCKTIVYEGTHGKLTVTGADAYGLPTAGDNDVIVGLIQLTKLHNGLTSPTVPFSRYALLKLLGRPDKSQYYRRLDESLNRWMGVTLVYENAWYDNRVKRRINAKFHILEDVLIQDRETRKAIREHQADLPFSSFTWNKTFFASFAADNVKKLDVATYFSLKSSISKQMFRFLDKRFYSADVLTFDLREFALGHIGLAKSYADFDLKRKLNVAIAELKEIGFLGEVTYASPRRGQWTIRLRRSGRTVREPSRQGVGVVGGA